MIKKADVMVLFQEAMPSFRARWDEYVAGADYEPDLLYLHLGEVVHTIVDLVKSGTREELPATFGVVERLHLEGDEYVREAATIGFLETLQNCAKHSQIDLEMFVPYLGRESRKWWDKLNRSWSGDPGALRL